MELITMTTNGNEPLVKLWIERNRLLKLANAAGKKAKFAGLAISKRRMNEKLRRVYAADHS